ncbi:DUF4350 domain-containing protein [Aquimarina mytili]|uniref:DUF4350 domain-containing protein n=1 Tax=Aquimarina mytili TaxID=874423 RepID=A0A937D8S8_9FLAO|nr:DUF4350 domain-containing protein [Aquimarina mytili]MBL0684370.1 DUF4350 domain-containing protein [Aquimarina mytili]
MDKKSRNILILFGVALLAIIIIELVRPTPINWKSSYTSTDKIPFGSYILFEELKELDSQKEINVISKNPYDFLDELEYKSSSTYVFINSSIDFDKRSYEKLITYVEQGNSVFISAGDFGQIIKDSLNIETEMEYQLTEKEITPTFFSSFIKEEIVPKFKKNIYKTVFKSFDTTKTTALGYYKDDEVQEKLSQVNFIKVKAGKGAIYFNTLPEAFSNYYMLNGNHKYAATCLSFLNDFDTLYWDDYLKDGRKIINSPMRFVLNQTPLRWAYYLLLIGLLIFVIFTGKREQRIIPIVKPLENTSIEFTKTIGNLYFQHKDYSDIISKKITYFLEKIRSTYYINTNTLNADFINRLAVKTNHSVGQTKELIDLINNLRGKAIHSEADLIALHKKVEEFTL